MVELLDVAVWRPFEVSRASQFKPFTSQNRMEVIMAMIKSTCRLETYIDAGVISRVFAMHDPPERDLVRQTWLPGRREFACPPPPFTMRTLRGLVGESPTNSFPRLSILRIYFGEEQAFFYAWYCHYTVFLSFLVVPGLLVAIVQLVTWRWTSLANPLFSLLIVVESSFQIQRWRRKQLVLAWR